MSEHSSISTQPTTVSPATAKTDSTALEHLQNEPETLSFQKPSIQFKLSIGAPDDPLEHEADAMAERVMRMPDPYSTTQFKNKNGSVIQRKCSHCEEEEKIQRTSETPEEEEPNSIMLKPDYHQFQKSQSSLIQRMSDNESEDDEEDSEQDESFTIKIQRKCSSCEVENEVKLKPLASSITPFIRAKRSNGGEISDTVNDQINSSRGNGHSLDNPTRSFMESRFDNDFSNVRIHHDSQSVQLNRELNAKAFTIGNDIYFNSGQYDPGSDSGKQLLAHELTHTIQQNGSIQQKQLSRSIIQRDVEVLEEPVFEPTDEEIDAADEGSKVEMYGIVEPEEGTNVWSAPGGTKSLIGLVKANTRVFVDRKHPGNWYEVYIEGHQKGEATGLPEGTHGYIAGERVNIDMPDPKSWLYKIESGEGGLAVAKKVYAGFTAEWGKDFRYLVNVLVVVNKEKGRKYIYKENEGDSWEDTKTMAGKRIWIPGMDLVNAMHGQISSGSISYEILSTIGNMLIGGAAFIVGILEGALMSIADIFIGIKDLIVMAVEIFTRLIKGTLILDAISFIDDISKIKMSDIIDMVDAKWNHPDIWERWKFRGYVIGYAIMEIVLLVFSFGAITAVKWAGKISKIGKLAEYLSKLPKVKAFIEGANKLTGAKVEKLKAALKAGHALSEAHVWAATALRIPSHILTRLSEVDIGVLKKLPQYLREKFARLSEKAMLLILGCRSPCKVDYRKIEEALKLSTKVGTKLTDPESVLKTLKSLPEAINVRKISVKLRKNPSALMTAIKEAGLTDADFAKLASFLTPADLTNAAYGYQTFVRYLTGVVPAKIGKDAKKMNEVAAALIKAEKGRGAAMKGPMFEAWIALHVPELSSKSFTKMVFDMKKVGKSGTRQADKWVPDEGAIWEIKHQFSKVPADQVDDYALLMGTQAADGKTVKSINYLFPTEDLAKLNKDTLKAKNMFAWYIDEATSTIKKSE